MESIGKLIREERKRQGLSQQQLASLARLSRATLSVIENGTVPEVGVRKLETVLRLLGFTLCAMPIQRPTLEQLPTLGVHDA